ncbi:unnamed protein product [Adineta ricciae]|uniref:SGNH hydrolase-type esterase domain-containing protein n=1 Tax=Adineta ricciae TaxID=249248 RepID=A0A815DIZ9_ADIRI|nr:unnamed protein product [Adineta ricciae]
MRAIFVLLFAFKLFILTNQQGGRYLVALGDSFTAGGGSKSYPHIAAGLLNWQVRNFAVGGATTHDIFSQLINSGTVLPLATHVVLTISGNDLDGLAKLANIARVNLTAFEEQCTRFKPTLASTYKQIKAAVRAETKIYALPYVDFISVGNRVPYEYESHKIIQTLNKLVEDAAAEANIYYVAAVVSAFRDHEMYSLDPYIDDFKHPTNPVHPNLKGHAKIGEVLAAYLQVNSG